MQEHDVGYPQFAGVFIMCIVRKLFNFKINVSKQKGAPCTSITATVHCGMARWWICHSVSVAHIVLASLHCWQYFMNSVLLRSKELGWSSRGLNKNVGRWCACWKIKPTSLWKFLGDSTTKSTRISLKTSVLTVDFKNHRWTTPGHNMNLLIITNYGTELYILQDTWHIQSLESLSLKHHSIDFKLNCKISFHLKRGHHNLWTVILFSNEFSQSLMEMAMTVSWPILKLAVYPMIVEAVVWT